MPVRLSRRRFLGGTLVVATVAACGGDDGGSGDGSSPTSGAPAGNVEPVGAPTSPFAADPFTLGVAAGDPGPDSLVLWTRLAPDPLADGGGAPGGAVDVVVDVALDPAFEQLVVSEIVTAEPDLAHSVHVTVDGLAPGTPHHYRFRLGEHTSTVGTARTTPASGDEDTFTFAFGSCQNYEQGFYGAHRHLAADGVDLVVWCGDYIYEGAIPDGVREHEGGVARTLDQYRQRYAQYRLDPDLQASHAAAAWAITWDDHEVANNHAGDVSAIDEAPDAFRARRAAAYQAWYEHLPVRLPPPDGADYRTFRTIRAGDLVSFHLVDTRQFRSDQPCDVPSDIGTPCDAVDDPARTMLGAEQEAALDTAVADSEAVWDVLVNQTVLAPAVVEAGPFSVGNLDQWDGYAAARRRLYDTLRRSANPVVVTGDIHAALIADLRADPDDPTSDLFGTELVTTSIASTFSGGREQLFDLAVSLNPLVRFADASRRGYVRCEVDRTRFVASYRLVDDATDPDTAIATAAAFELTAGRPGVNRLD